MVNFGRFLAERQSTPIWCRSARISTRRAARERKTESRVARNGDKALNMGLASHSGISGNPHDLREIEFTRSTILIWKPKTARYG
jgi:hypothetical protein